MEKDFRRITLVAGAFLILFGVLIVWRGLKDMIRVAGLLHGGLFTLAGVFFFVFGLCLLLVPGRQARKKKKETEGKP